MKNMFSLFIYIEAAPSRDVQVFSLSEKSETFYLVTYVGGFSLWKNDNMCQYIYIYVFHQDTENIYVRGPCRVALTFGVAKS